jgi:hypothetical protein
MEIEELEQAAICVACGAPVDETTHRAYAFGEDGLLCWSCALDRGGIYDTEQEIWVSAPDLEGLPDARAPHP